VGLSLSRRDSYSERLRPMVPLRLLAGVSTPCSFLNRLLGVEDNQLSAQRPPGSISFSPFLDVFFSSVFPSQFSGEVSPLIYWPFTDEQDQNPFFLTPCLEISLSVVVRLSSAFLLDGIGHNFQRFPFHSRRLPFRHIAIPFFLVFCPLYSEFDTPHPQQNWISWCSFAPFCEFVDPS